MHMACCRRRRRHDEINGTTLTFKEVRRDRRDLSNHFHIPSIFELVQKLRNGGPNRVELHMPIRVLSNGSAADCMEVESIPV